jgi:hypothetical protein
MGNLHILLGQAAHYQGNWLKKRSRMALWTHMCLFWGNISKPITWKHHLWMCKTVSDNTLMKCFVSGAHTCKTKRITIQTSMTIILWFHTPATLSAQSKRITTEHLMGIKMYNNQILIHE